MQFEVPLELNLSKHLDDLQVNGANFIGPGPYLTEGWTGQASFSLLDLDFGDGSRWRATYAAWRADTSHSSKRPRLLHYVALVPGLPAGFQRQTFDHGRVLLTLCGGAMTAALKELRFEADRVVLPLGSPAVQPAGAAFNWDIWAVKLLARCCRRGTRLHLEASASVAVPELDAILTLFRSQGFELTQHIGGAGVGRVNGSLTGASPNTGDNTFAQGIYNPRWTPKNRRNALQDPLSVPLALPTTHRRCIVIGAGLAGASCAFALALRGWAVQVIDAHLQPAMGASSLPAGLLVAHTSADDSPRSRMSRAGLHLTVEQSRRLLVEGQDWQASGVLTLKPGVPPERHAGAAWVKPAALIQAWLAAPGIEFTGGVTVAALRCTPVRAVERVGVHVGLPPGLPAGVLGAQRRAGSDVAPVVEPVLKGVAQHDPSDSAQGHPSEMQAPMWEVLDSHGRVIASAPLIVVAAAGRSTALLQASHGAQLSAFGPLTDVPGQVSWGLQREGDLDWMPPGPVNGLGSFLPNVPGVRGCGVRQLLAIRKIEPWRRPRTPAPGWPLPPLKMPCSRWTKPSRIKAISPACSNCCPAPQRNCRGVLKRATSTPGAAYVAPRPIACRSSKRLHPACGSTPVMVRAG